MIYLLDTNIILLNLQKKPLAFQIREELGLDNVNNDAYISVVTVGEIQSLALQNKWGESRTVQLNEYINSFITLDINVQAVIDRYAQIDAYSQNRLADRPLNLSARNMGKNDLWIAATASVLDATLVTTDNDFVHLDGQFLTLKTYPI